MSQRVVIASALRTPFTRAKRGELKDTRPDTMAAWAIRAAVAAVPNLEGAEIEDVVLGCAMPEAEQGMNVARPAAMLAGLPDSVAALTINRFCASGVQSIGQLGQAIRSGAIDIGVAGGTESMTMVPMGGNKPSANLELMTSHPEVYTMMGATAENVAARFGVTREEQDRFAYESQRRAGEAQAAGRLDDEIFEITTSWFDGDEAKIVTLKRDTIIRPETSYESLAALKPAFRAKGTVTAGNASPLTDGAAAAVMMSEKTAIAKGVTPLGYFVDLQVVGVPADIMGIGPVPAIAKLQQRTGLGINDFDLVEINEAFAAQVLAVLKDVPIPAEKLNVNGGAIALGHPIGCSGARIIVTLLHELMRRGQKRGLATLCVSGGMGMAMAIETL